jgi:hypothetical protein
MRTPQQTKDELVGHLVAALHFGEHLSRLGNLREQGIDPCRLVVTHTNQVVSELDIGGHRIRDAQMLFCSFSLFFFLLKRYHIRLALSLGRKP